MKRIGTVTLTVLALAIPPANAVAAIRSNAEAKATPKKTVITRKVVGGAGQADRWGTVQVTLTVRKTTTVSAKGKKKVVRKATAVDATYQVHTGRSQFIMEQALPILRQEALAAQSANIQFVSGATNTSEAFQQSLQSAIVKALAL
jgi:uncharacterized protein with FMN-binding domain